MIVAMAWKSLAAHPVRTLVLGVGFGLGVSVMATLLGVGQVVLQQAQAPELVGGGDLLVSGGTGAITSARFVLGRLREGMPSADAPIASPQRHAELFLVGHGGVVPVGARGGIPSLERALGDPETASIPSWQDAPADAAWASPEPGAVLRAMDRFHPVPDVPGRSASWAEWLYFRGQSGEVRFYLTFMVGPRRADGQRIASVRLQLDRGGRLTNYSDHALLNDAEVLASAPDITIGRSQVRLEGMAYRITLDLPDEAGSGSGTAVTRAHADLVIEGTPGRSFAPVVMRGAGEWLSGYAVPVMSGRLTGSLSAGGDDLTLAGTGYHDHNWGFWEGVSWRWGQVQHDGLSYLYGRVYPPADVADQARLPGFLMAISPDGSAGYATNVTITETDDPATGRPTRIVVEGRGGGLDLKLDLTVDSAVVTKGGALVLGPDFLQLRVTYHVTGHVGGRDVDFTEAGAAETFRGTSQER